MKPIQAALFILVCLLSQSFLGFNRTATIFPVFDPPGIRLPRNFRMPDTKDKKLSGNDKGLSGLKASGSGQFSEKTLAEMIRCFSCSPERIVVIDLRQESHGFINGEPVSWTDGNFNYANLHKTKSEIESDEWQRLSLVARARKIVLNPDHGPTKLKVHSVKTEKDIVQSRGCHYLRLPVTDLNRPSNEVIDQFIAYVKEMPHDQWIHFHCRAGKGRTTTFLTMLDIMKNGHQVAFEEIIARQKLIGGSDLSAVRKPSLEKSRAAQERYEFVKKFYHYCRQVPDFSFSWSEWVDRKPVLADNH